MTTYVPVSPGINLASLLGERRLTKVWVREAMRDHPEWDWRNLGLGFTYVNGEDAVRENLILQVMRDGTTVCLIHFQQANGTVEAVVS